MESFLFRARNQNRATPTPKSFFFPEAALIVASEIMSDRHSHSFYHAWLRSRRRRVFFSRLVVPRSKKKNQQPADSSHCWCDRLFIASLGNKTKWIIEHLGYCLIWLTDRFLVYIAQSKDRRQTWLWSNRTGPDSLDNLAKNAPYPRLLPNQRIVLFASSWLVDHRHHPYKRFPRGPWVVFWHPGDRVKSVNRLCYAAIQVQLPGTTTRTTKLATTTTTTLLHLPQNSAAVLLPIIAGVNLPFAGRNAGNPRKKIVTDSWNPLPGPPALPFFIRPLPLRKHKKWAWWIAGIWI